MLLGIVIIFIVGYFASKAIQDARGRPWAGPRTPQMRSRAVASASRPKRPGTGRRTALAVKGSARPLGAMALHPTSRLIRVQARADIEREWQKAFAAEYVEAQRHARETGTAAPGGIAAAPAGPLAQRLRLAPQMAFRREGIASGPAPAAADPPSVQEPRAERPPPDGTARTGTGGSATGPGPGNGAPPARQSPPPAPPSQPASSNGGTPVEAGTNGASGSAGAEQFIDGVNKIHATAAAGGINAKQAAIKAATEGCIRFAGMLQMVARQMTEQGRYGPEITEPLAKAATHLQAGAMTLGESDTAITTLKHMQVGELAMSARRAPHHDELNEAGNR